MSDELMSSEDAAQAMADAVRAKVREVLREPLESMHSKARDELVSQVALAATTECFVFLDRVQAAAAVGENELPKARSPYSDGGVT